MQILELNIDEIKSVSGAGRVCEPTNTQGPPSSLPSPPEPERQGNDRRSRDPRVGGQGNQPPLRLRGV